MSRYQKKCVNCGCDLDGLPSGDSSIYGAGDRHVLCEPCFFSEEELQEERGTNNLPEILAKYDENLKAWHH
jgi:hypothetical protein